MTLFGLAGSACPLVWLADDSTESNPLLVACKSSLVAELIEADASAAGLLAADEVAEYRPAVAAADVWDCLPHTYNILKMGDMYISQCICATYIMLLVSALIEVKIAACMEYQGRANEIRQQSIGFHINHTAFEYCRILYIVGGGAIPNSIRLDCRFYGR